MTLLIASAHATIPANLKYADMLEIRIDGMSLDLCRQELPKLLADSPIPTIVTCRSASEGGLFEGSEEERVEMYNVALQSKHPPKYIDIEYEIAILHPLLIDRFRTEQTGIILSWHDMRGQPQDLFQRAKAMQDITGVAIVKMAWRARSIRDNFDAFTLLQSRQQPMIALCMGEYGILSRILAPKFGGFATFASATNDSATAPGQLSIEKMHTQYGIRRIERNTKIFAVIGNNVAHSDSPKFHNLAFQAAGRNAVYVPIQIPKGWEHLKASMNTLVGTVGFDFAGASITIPHKEEMLKLVDKPDQLCTQAKAINTFLVQENQSKATNTDVNAIAQLTASCTNVLILGSGGVARAALTALERNKANAHICARNTTSANILRQEFKCCTLDASEKFDYIINCTPVGMKGSKLEIANPLDILAPWLILDKSMTVFDTVYIPKETRLLRAATEAGCNIIHGQTMFQKQAALQQLYWDKLF